MNFIVDQDLCISCGLCVDTCPDIFDWNEEGRADVILKEVPGEKQNCSFEAMEDCPVDAIQNSNKTL